MFKKVKRDFLALNMIIISMLMIIVCISVYLAMRANMLNVISEDMMLIEEYYKGYFNMANITNTEYNTDILDGRHFFVEDVDIKYNMRYSNASNYFDENLRNKIVYKCVNSRHDTGIVSDNNFYYSYSKIYNNEDSIRLIVLDVTDRMVLLHQLAMSLVSVGVFALFAIFLISYFFMSKSVKPLEEAFFKQKNFISDASHELKTPLAVVKTNVDVVLHSDKVSDEDKKWLIYAKDEIDQMSTMVNEFLYLAKMENVKEVKIYENVNFSNIVSGVLLSMEAIAFEKNIIIEEDIEEDIFTVGSKDELIRLVKILVDNAIKYCNNGGDIKVILNKDAKEGVLLVKNTGTVIDAKDSKVIFERFYRTNKERERASHSYGLGLSIARSTCDRHGFYIKAYPKNDMTCFKVTFKTLNV